MAKKRGFICRRYPELLVISGDKQITKFTDGKLITEDEEIANFVANIPEVKEMKKGTKSINDDTDESTDSEKTRGNGTEEKEAK